MAAPRWRLINAHYLNVIIDGEQSAWEYAEQSRQTGRMIRKKHNVPFLLDPKDPQNFNYPELELIVVCRGEPDRGYERDFQFFGDPTPDMEPMNDEAQAITDTFKDKWAHPIESLSGNYGDEVARTFEAQLRDVMAKAISQPVPAQSVGPDVLMQLKAMQEQINSLQNIELQAGAPLPVDDAKPLEDLPVDPVVPPSVVLNRPPQVGSRR